MIETEREDNQNSIGLSYDHQFDNSPLRYKIKGMSNGEFSGGVGYSF